MFNLETMARRATPNTLVASTIGTALRKRRMGVGELQRRLAERGINVSHGALDRLAADRPLKAVNFELLMPVLEELDIELGEPFMSLPSEEHEHQRTARALALQATRVWPVGTLQQPKLRSRTRPMKLTPSLPRNSTP